MKQMDVGRVEMAPIVDLVDSQIIASVKKESDLEKAINSTANVVFLLTGNLMNIKDYVSKLKKHDKVVFIHLDFIDGISNNKSAVQYIARVCRPTGIITTKSNLIKYAKEENLLTILRLFLIDYAALNKGIDVINSCKPDAVELLPGVIPKIIDHLEKILPMPIIAGGLISNKEEILEALSAGALAVSSGSPNLWSIDL